MHPVTASFFKTQEISPVTNQGKMRIFLLTASLLLAGVLAQDTYNCPDGWTKHEHHGHCNCFLMSGSEAVTQPDAEVLCAFHDGAWLAELDHPGNYYFFHRIETKLLSFLICFI